MKSDLKANNNKFYIIQVLKEKSSGRLYFYKRYGRVGENGVQIKDLLSEAVFLNEYNKAYRQKTGAGKGYTEIDMKLGSSATGCKAEIKAISKTTTESSYLPSKLPKQVNEFVNFIYDKDLMEKSVA